MFSPSFNTMLSFESSNESWIPIYSLTLVSNLEDASQRDLTDQSSEAIPKSLQHRIKAFDLHPSVAVGRPDGSKKVCSPLATETSLRASERGEESVELLNRCAAVHGQLSPASLLAKKRNRKRACLQHRDPTTNALVTHRPPATNPHSLETNILTTVISPLGTIPQPPGPKA